MRTDINGTILQVGDRVIVQATACGSKACKGKLGIIDHFGFNSPPMAFIRFDEPIPAEDCPLAQTWGEGNRKSCGLYLDELVLVKSMGNDPRQKKIEECAVDG